MLIKVDLLSRAVEGPLGGISNKFDGKSHGNLSGKRLGVTSWLFLNFLFVFLEAFL
jgi:hypothetical protein